MYTCDGCSNQVSRVTRVQLLVPMSYINRIPRKLIEDYCDECMDVTPLSPIEKILEVLEFNPLGA